MTATQADSDGGMTRRGVMRRTAIGVGAAATLGATASGSAAAVDWETAGKVAATTLIGGPAAAGAIAYGAIFDGPKKEDVSESLGWQTHVDEYTRSREDGLMLDQTLASLERDVQLVSNKAREEAIFRVYEQGVDGGTEADATAAAEAAISEAYATVEKAVLDSWTIRNARAEVVNDIFADYHGSPNTVLISRPGSAGHGTYDKFEGDLWAPTTHTLVDGTTMEYIGQTLNSGSAENYAVADPLEDVSALAEYTNSFHIPKPDPATYSVDETPPDGPADVVLFDTEPWYNILQELYTGHSNVQSEVTSMVDTYYTAAQDGDIDLTNLLGPAHLTNTAKNASDFQEATMALRGMGFSIAEQTSVVSFKQDGTSYELDGRLARTVQDPNDLPVGSELEPSTITGSIYGAFNIKNDAGERVGEIFEITKPFTIQTAEGEDAVSFKRREIVEADSTLTTDEVEAIFAENYEANKDATENVYDTATTTSGGGGGFLSGSGDVKTLGIVAGAGALAALLFGNN